MFVFICSMVGAALSTAAMLIYLLWRRKPKQPVEPPPEPLVVLPEPMEQPQQVEQVEEPTETDPEPADAFDVGPGGDDEIKFSEMHTSEQVEGQISFWTYKVARTKNDPVASAESKRQLAYWEAQR
jgi:hypothetical protein